MNSYADDCLANEPIEFFRGSSNIYRDFDIPNPDLQLAKSTIGSLINKWLVDQHLSPRQAQCKTGISHLEFLRIRKVEFDRFNLERLFEIYHILEPCRELVLTVRNVEGQPLRMRPADGILVNID